MGAAFGKGFVKALIEFAKENPELARGLMISVYDFDPFQAEELTAEERVHTLQLTHNGKRLFMRNFFFFGLKKAVSDRIADEMQGGLIDMYGLTHGDNNEYIESPHKSDHSIMSFFNDITNLDQGTYKLIDGKWVKQ